MEGITLDGKEAGCHVGRPAHSDEEEIRLLRAELMAARQRLADAAFERDAALKESVRFQAQVSALRNSMSWKVTRPLRACRRRMRGGDF